MAAGFKSTIYRTSLSASTTGEALGSYAGSTTIFSITNRTKSVIDVTQAYTFKEDGVPISASDINKLSNYVGLVEFKTVKTGTITADYNYLVLDEICSFKSLDLTLDFSLQDSTVLCSANQGYKIYEETIKMGSGTFDGLVKQNESIDNETINQNGLIVICNFTDYFQAGFKLKTTTNSYNTAVEELVTNSYSYVTDGEPQLYIV